MRSNKQSLFIKLTQTIPLRKTWPETTSTTTSIFPSNASIIEPMQNDPILVSQMSFNTFRSILALFRAALTKQKANDINASWDKHSLLFHAWFYGKPIQFTNQQSQPDIQFCKDLLSAFKSVLGGRSLYVISRVWGEKGENIKLQEAIKALNHDESQKLLISVMNSNTHGKSPFISLYVNFITTASIINSVLKSIQETSSSSQKNKITILKNRLDILSGIKSAEENAVAEKRKISSGLESMPRKKQKTVSAPAVVLIDTTVGQDFHQSGYSYDGLVKILPENPHVRFSNSYNIVDQNSQQLLEHQQLDEKIIFPEHDSFLQVNFGDYINWRSSHDVEE